MTRSKGRRTCAKLPACMKVERIDMVTWLAVAEGLVSERELANVATKEEMRGLSQNLAADIKPGIEWSTSEFPEGEPSQMIRTVQADQGSEILKIRTQ